MCEQTSRPTKSDRCISISAKSHVAMKGSAACVYIVFEVPDDKVEVWLNGRCHGLVALAAEAVRRDDRR